jgi:cytochrome o ubiquinol oxidase subunit II
MALFDPAGRVGDQEKRLIVTAAVLMLVVVIPVIVMAVAFAWRYRASNSRARYSPEWSHSRVIEILVWVVPVAIVSVLGYLSWTMSHSLDPFRPLASKTKPVVIQVISMDWKWLFIYPDENVATVNEIAFPVGTPVDFTVTSDTVMNSFFIPQLGSQIYAMAGMETQLHLIADRAGSYRGLSANFSGDGFSGMQFTALAMSDARYRGWLAKAKRSAEKLDAESYARLAAPSEKNAVEYFSSVTPHLFSDVAHKYAQGGMKQMPMSSGF